MASTPSLGKLVPWAVLALALATAPHASALYVGGPGCTPACITIDFQPGPPGCEPACLAADVQHAGPGPALHLYLDPPPGCRPGC
jgi:hypothetical protein